MEVSEEEAAEKLEELIAAAQSGEDIVILCDGVPTVRLVALPEPPARRSG
jgi:antitoxin (DNA-binding transcriptional repressor) of toxin-antitoxin stability system